MSLPTVPFGKTGMDITRVGFGAWAAGGGGWSFSWGPQDDEESITAICHAVERGVNWVDTAPVYGLGHSEEVVAAALKGIPEADRPYIFTKCGLRWDPDKPYERAVRIGRRDSLREEVENSLRRLQVDVIDLYQMHWPPDDGTPVEDYWSTMAQLKEEGKVRHIGLSNHSVAQLDRAEAIAHVETLQPPFSAVKRQAAGEIAWCSAHSTGVIVYAPMQSGLLTGKFSPGRVAELHADDWRARDPEFQGERLDRNLALVDALRPIAERHGTTLPTVAVAWALSWPGVTGAIVGGRNPSQVDGWTAAASLSLSEADLEEIAKAIETTGAGGGPARPGEL